MTSRGARAAHQLAACGHPAARRAVAVVRRNRNGCNVARRRANLLRWRPIRATRRLQPTPCLATADRRSIAESGSSRA